MATKSSGISRSGWRKALAVIVTVVGALAVCYGALELPSFPYAFQGEVSAEAVAGRALDEALHGLRLWGQLRSEEYIKTGEVIGEELAYYAKHRLEAHNDSVRWINERYAAWIGSARASGNAQEAERLTAERDRQIAQEQDRLDRDMASERERLISHMLHSYQSVLSSLGKPPVRLYHARLGTGETLGNIGAIPDVAGFFAGLPAHAKTGLPGGGTAYVGVSPDTVAALLEQAAQHRARGLAGLYTLAAGLLVGLGGLGYVVYAAGSAPGSPGVTLGPLDRVYLDVSLAVLGVPAAAGIRGLFGLAGSYRRYGAGANLPLGALLASGITLLGLIWASMAAKRLKRGEFVRHTLVCVALTRCFRVARKLWAGTVEAVLEAGSLAMRAAGLALAYSLALGLAALFLIAAVTSRSPLAALFGAAPFVALNLAAFVYVASKASELQGIIAGTERIRSGELSWRVPEPNGKDLAKLARGINNMADGLKAAVDREVRAERLKAELVTNVSHDLKTPLTSLITYIDLLKTEGLRSDNAAKYLGVLEQKAQRLRALTEDLFEAAKLASGNVICRPERLDLGSLLTQGLGELSDRVQASGLDFRVSLPQEKLWVRADGRLLWRAIENVLGNALKYALAGTRVYVEATDRGHQVLLSVKNISASPLNVDPAELMERFKRGDESRSSEGSGLGLSIAKSLLELQRGSFHVEIDGDLFKVTIALPADPPGPC